MAGLGSANSLLEQVVSQVPPIIEEVNRWLPRKFPALVADRIFDGVQRMAKAVAADL